MAKAAADGGAPLRRLHRQVLNAPINPGAIGQTTPVSDPSLQSAATLFSFWQSQLPLFGVITDGTSIANVYRVQFEKAVHPTPCVLLTDTNASAAGARSLATLQPGQQVLCMIHPAAGIGTIIGVLPPAGLASNRSLMQQILHATRNRVDEGHKKPLRMGGNGMIADYTAGRPFDSTLIGEQGWITETGLRIFIDPFMVTMGVDEACGVTAFYHDQLLRIAAYNLHMFTAGSVRHSINDQEECDDWTGYTAYSWENLGMFERKDPRRELDARKWQINEPHYGPWEPGVNGGPEDRLQPWHRETEYHGYLGQGGKRLVVLAPKSPPPCNTFDGGSGEGAKFIGVFDETISLDGRYTLASAKGISIVKRMAILAPKQRRPPEQIQDEGDNETNYKAGGIVGGGPEHKITGDLKTSGNYETMQRASGILDLHAYLFNYGVVHPFFWHAKDWKVEQESDLDYADGGGFDVPIFSELADKTFLDPPSPKKLKVDHRYGEQNFYRNECGIDWLEDGGLVIYDGFGAEIKLAGGSITFSAPGDLWMKAGRNVNHWAGYDLILRAKNSMDLTATEKDVRVKAEKNLHMLAGNSGTGGMLLESRAKTQIFDFEGNTGEDVESAGIMLRAVDSKVIAWGQDVYIRSLEGDVVIDADKGKKDIVTHAANLIHFVDGGVNWFFGTEGNIRKANEFSEEWATIASGLCIGDVALINGDILNRGWILTAAGHIATEFAEQSSFFVAPLTGDGLAETNEALDDCTDRADVRLPKYGETYYTAFLQTQFYDDDKPGNDDTIKFAEVSLRSIEQYRTTDFVLFEDRWQQLATLTGQTGAKWREKPVVCQADPETYPYPGKTNFTGNKFYQQESKLVEASGMAVRSKSRGSDGELSAEYLNPEYGPQTPVSLVDNYIIIR